MKKTTGKSWNSVATRDLWGAISRQDPQAVARALSKQANPNDQKRINPWSPADTPLLQAARSGFTAGIPLLVQAGARRRSSGKDAVSALMRTVEGDQPEAFDTLCQKLGSITEMELLDCCVAIRSFKGPGSSERMHAWIDRLLDAVEDYPVRLTPTVAAAIAMQFLGGESLPDPVRPDIVQKLVDRQLLTPQMVARATQAGGLQSWGDLLSRRTRKPDDENEARAVALLHELRAPFAAMAAAQEGEPPRWLQEQMVHQAATVLEESTTPATPSATHRPRL